MSKICTSLAVSGSRHISDSEASWYCNISSPTKTGRKFEVQTMEKFDCWSIKASSQLDDDGLTIIKKFVEVRHLQYKSELWETTGWTPHPLVSDDSVASDPCIAAWVSRCQAGSPRLDSSSWISNPRNLMLVYSRRLPKLPSAAQNVPRVFVSVFPPQPWAGKLPKSDGFWMFNMRRDTMTTEVL